MALGLSRGAGVMKGGAEAIASVLREARAVLDPLAAERTAELDAAFARHSLERDALQAAFVFVGSAAIAGTNGSSTSPKCVLASRGSSDGRMSTACIAMVPLDISSWSSPVAGSVAK